MKTEKYTRDPITIYNTFDNFFTSVAETVQSKIKILNKSLEDFYQQKNNDSFIITATNKDKIHKIISSLTINKSCGLNSIPIKILHLV